MGDVLSEKKIFRSLIKKYFPIDLLIKLDEISMTNDIDNNSKTPEITSLLDAYKVPYTKLGNGTNRYGILIDGYAVKIALDRLGKTDNKREFKYAKLLYPKVVKVYECLETGLVATFEYITIFSLDEFYDNQSRMREILSDISKEFLVGDVGVSTHNYINWGTRLNGDIAILDFAYIYSLSYKGFKCTCDDEGMLEFDKDFNYLICPFCRKKWTFGDIRKRITKQDEINEIGDIMQLGYVLHEPEEELNIDPTKTPIKVKVKNKKSKQHEKDIDKSYEPEQDWDIDSSKQQEILKSLNNNIFKRNKWR